MNKYDLLYAFITCYCKLYLIPSRVLLAKCFWKEGSKALTSATPIYKDVPLVPISIVLYFAYANSAWSKHWHAGRMRPADSYCAARERFLHAVYCTKS